MTVESDVCNEIEVYMTTNKERYRSFLNDLRSEVTDIRNRYDVNRLIYSIYSRSDKQKGDELKFEDAMHDAKAVLTFAEEIGDETETANAKGTLAYFLAEVAAGMPKQPDELAAEARHLSKAALSSLPNDEATQDTRGMILIAFGENEEEVREGLRLCELAWQKAPDSQKHIADAFFRLHERRAFRRLLEWD